MANDDVIARSHQLDDEIAGSGSIRELVRYGHRNRILIWLTVLSLGIDICLTIAIGLQAHQAQLVAQQATSIQRQAYTTCLAGNDSRARELTLWEHVLSLNAPQTVEQQQQSAAFAAYVRQLYAPKRCIP